MTDNDWLIVRRGLVAALVLMSSSAAHFFGFVGNFPAGLQRLVVTSFATEFIGIFFYYVTVSAIGARIGVLLILGFFRSWPHLYRLSKVSQSREAKRQYLRGSAGARSLMDWLPLAVFPVVLAVVYAEPYETMAVAACLAVASALIVPIRLPHVSISLCRFKQRMADKRRLRFRLRNSIEIVLVFAVFFVGLSYFAGISRFSRLEKAEQTTLSSENFNGRAVILLQSGDAMLLLERSANGDQKRYLLITDHLVAAETVPLASDQFTPIKFSK